MNLTSTFAIALAFSTLSLGCVADDSDIPVEDLASETLEEEVTLEASSDEARALELAAAEIADYSEGELAELASAIGGAGCSTETYASVLAGTVSATAIARDCQGRIRRTIVRRLGNVTRRATQSRNGTLTRSSRLRGRSECTSTAYVEIDNIVVSQATDSHPTCGN